ncbi:MAG: AgmX/PglI C-terminal domain-containing protein [Polyangiaceae bacterium]
MRAVPTPNAVGPRVLRVGLVQAGKIIEERVIEDRSHVLIGPSEKSTFVLPTKTLPPTFRLFERLGDDYVLNFTDAMNGRVALKSGLSDLDSLRPNVRRTRQSGVDVSQVPLPQDSRGKVVVGDTIFLFQFVPPTPQVARPQLPVSVKSGLAIDWNTTLIAAFSFLFHFGLIGSIYSDWMDPPLNEDLSVQLLIETVKALPPPPQEEQEKTEEVATEATAAATAAATAPSPAATAKTASKGDRGVSGPSGGNTGKTGRGTMSEADRVSLSNDLDRFNVEMTGALNGPGVSTDQVLTDADVPMGRLNDANQSSSGSGFGKVAFGSQTGPTGRPGENGKDGLKDLGDKGKNEQPTAPGSSRPVAGPKTGNAAIGSPTATGSRVANAASVVAGMTSGFRRCYNAGLKTDPDMQGSVRITAKIGPNGEVTSATPSGGGGLSAQVVGCVVSRVASAQFDKPEGGGATIVIPVSFKAQ